tara:strand:+ start:103 stop:1212 length:1110 start_codon:yes stop_codon:yes gene_type:complete
MKSTLNFYYPSIEGGGVEKNLFSLINSLAKKKYKINFFTYENNTKNSEFKRKFYFNQNIKVITSSIIPGIKNRYLKYFFCIFTLFFFSLLKKNVIVSFQSNVLAILVAKITFSKVIIRCNTAPSKYINSFFKKKFFKFFYNMSDIILVLSKEFKEEFYKFFQLECVIHRQSLDIKEIKKQSITKVNFDFFKKFNGLKIVNVGRLTDQKNQITLLKAFERLIKVRKARLLLIGRGTDKEKLLDYIYQKKLSDKIKIIPYINNPFKYISLSDLKVLSSKYEGNPNILLEVACLKKFIISTNCKLGPKQILQSGKGGILYKVGDYNKLYLILKKINLNSKETKKKIINSYNYVQNNFEKDVSKPFIEIMKEL